MLPIFSCAPPFAFGRHATLLRCCSSRHDDDGHTLTAYGYADAAISPLFAMLMPQNSPSRFRYCHLLMIVPPPPY